MDKVPTPLLPAVTLAPMDPNPARLDSLLASGLVDLTEGLVVCVECAQPLGPVSSVGLVVQVVEAHLSTHTEGMCLQ